MILLAVLALAAAPHSHSAHGSYVAHGKAPTDWTRVASATAAGGFVMGNPAAKVKLVEYGSLTCPHCRHFDETAAAPLAAYVRTGRVSWEFRPFLLSGYDIPATLTASCTGPVVRATRARTRSSASGPNAQDQKTRWCTLKAAAPAGTA